MRHFKWLEPGENDEPVECDATEDEIMENYFPYWCDQMRKIGKGDQISREACLEDFMVVHWAWETES